MKSADLEALARQRGFQGRLSEATGDHKQDYIRYLLSVEPSATIELTSEDTKAIADLLAAMKVPNFLNPIHHENLLATHNRSIFAPQQVKHQLGQAVAGSTRMFSYPGICRVPRATPSTFNN